MSVSASTPSVTPTTGVEGAQAAVPTYDGLTVTFACKENRQIESSFLDRLRRKYSLEDVFGLLNNTTIDKPDTHIQSAPDKASASDTTSAPSDRGQAIDRLACAEANDDTEHSWTIRSRRFDSKCLTQYPASDCSDSTDPSSAADANLQCQPGSPLTSSSSETGVTQRLQPIVRKRTPSICFSNDCMYVAASPIAGWGGFAAKTLYRGDVILREAPLFMASSESLLARFRQLPQAEKAVALSLHANDQFKEGIAEIKGVWDTNCFAVDRYNTAGLFPIAARLNHACSPSNNVAFRFDSRSQCLQLTVREDVVDKDAELTICYVEECEPLHLHRWYGFQCKCGVCPGLTDAQVKAWNAFGW